MPSACMSPMPSRGSSRSTPAATTRCARNDRLVPPRAAVRLIRSRRTAAPPDRPLRGWRKQIEDLSRDHHVVAVDTRGHGDSDKPDHGYRIARLAADLHELVTQLDLRDIRWIAHSMGCSVTWSYWDLFGGDRIAKLVLVDQPAVLVADPAGDEGDKERMSAVFDYTTVSALSAGLRSADAQAVTESLISGMFTASAAPEDVAWAIERNIALPRAQAGTLLMDHCYQNWRDLLPRINVPTLVIGGAVSLFPPAGIEWVAEQISDAKVRIFSEQERGSHFMFWENAELFNTVVREFFS